MSAAERAGSALATKAPSRLNSQALLVTVLADYSFAAAGEFPSGAIVDIMGEFGISAAGARVALSRVAKSGMLVQSRQGRKTSYALNEDGLIQREQRLKRYLDFGEAKAQWDGRWTIVLFSVPEEDRVLRPRFRRELEKLRLAPLTDAVWLQSADCGTEVARAGAELGVTFAVLRAEFQHTALAGLDPLSAFDLERIRALYDDYHAEFTPWITLMREGRIAPTHALVLRTNVLARWREIVLADPDLPRDILPDNWPQARARAIFVELWEGLGAIALNRVRSLVSRHDPEAASRLRLRAR